MHGRISRDQIADRLLEAAKPLETQDAGRFRVRAYECVYLNAFETGSEARNGIGPGSAITTKNARTHHTGC